MEIKRNHVMPRAILVALHPLHRSRIVLKRPTDSESLRTASKKHACRFTQRLLALVPS